MKLKNKSALISGASQGLGVEIAKHFVQEGANVVLCARDIEKLEQVRTQLMALAPIQNKIIIKQADVSNHKQTMALVQTALDELGGLDILVANAAIFGAKGAVEETDWEEWSQTIDINLKGTVLQCKAVLPHFKAKQKGKIIILSGGGATKPMPYFSAYAASKAGVVRFAETLAEEVSAHHIDVNAVAPGALNTRFLEEVLQAGEGIVGDAYYAKAVKQKQEGGVPLHHAAALCAFLASNASDGITGKLISAVWDDWQTLSTHLHEMQASDIYTLRRIVPKDRGKTWGEPQ